MKNVLGFISRTTQTLLEQYEEGGGGEIVARIDREHTVAVYGPEEYARLQTELAKAKLDLETAYQRGKSEGVKQTVGETQAILDRMAERHWQALREYASLLAMAGTDSASPKPAKTDPVTADVLRALQTSIRKRAIEECAELVKSSPSIRKSAAWGPAYLAKQIHAELLDLAERETHTDIADSDPALERQLAILAMDISSTLGMAIYQAGGGKCANCGYRVYHDGQAGPDRPHAAVCEECGGIMLPVQDPASEAK